MCPNHMPTSYCEKCGKELTPAQSFYDGEPGYCGWAPCPCIHPIMTDMGVVYPGSEDHAYIVKNKMYPINDLLTPINN